MEAMSASTWATVRLWGVAIAKDAAESRSKKVDLIWTIAREKFKVELCGLVRKVAKIGGCYDPFYTKYYRISDAFNEPRCPKSSEMVLLTLYSDLSAPEISNGSTASESSIGFEYP